MRVQVLFFGPLREITGVAEESAECLPGDSLGSLFDQYSARFPKIAAMREFIVLARNREFAPLTATMNEGDEVAGFRVIELPGHSPGQIGLWRESDRLALSSDCFYTIDLWGRSCDPQLPAAFYNYDTEQARSSLRKLAALEPAAAWPGHARPATGDVRAQLERAADAAA